MTEPDAVSEHYTVADLEERLLAALAEGGKDLDALTPDDLAPIDAFHVRGRAATEELAAELALDEGTRLLDVGSGLGGTARFLASRFGCPVVGVELTPTYRDVAERLSARVGLSERTEFHQGSALELPFPDGSFDVVWTEHVQMNVADKERFYREAHRVLRPGGRLAFHDIFAGGPEAPHYPVPWASDPSISHLIRVAPLKELLDSLGFRPLVWRDVTDSAQAFFQGLVRRVGTEGWKGPGLYLLVSEPEARFGNMLRNLEEGRLRLIQAVLERPADS